MLRRARRPPGALQHHGTVGSITVHSMGGLGNQLFIYAAGLAIARASDAALRVDTSQHAARADRPPLLQRYGFPAEYVQQERRSTLGLLVKSNRFNDVPRRCVVRDLTICGDTMLGPLPAGSCLYGYFQRWHYPELVAEDMRGHAAGLAARRLAAFERQLEHLREPDSIVLHVRRGDYLIGEGRVHGVASPDYYRSAIENLRKMGFVGKVYVFSDDIPLAVNELSRDLAVHPLLDRPVDAMDELLLMSHAASLVMANSSFSWWAAWLGERPGRPVIAPRPWFDAPGIDSRDLLPPLWLTLDRRALPTTAPGERAST